MSHGNGCHEQAARHGRVLQRVAVQEPVEDNPVRFQELGAGDRWGHRQLPGFLGEDRDGGGVCRAQHSGAVGGADGPRLRRDRDAAQPPTGLGDDVRLQGVCDRGLRRHQGPAVPEGPEGRGRVRRPKGSPALLLQCWLRCGHGPLRVQQSEPRLCQHQRRHVRASHSSPRCRGEVEDEPEPADETTEYFLL